MQLAFNLSNGVTDTLESTTILIYLETHMGLYIQRVARCRIDSMVDLKMIEKAARVFAVKM